MKAWRLWLRGILTAALLGCVAVRVVRMVARWESVARYYGVGTYGTAWSFISLLFFAGPFLAALAAVVSLWLKQRWDAGVSLAALFVSGFLVLWEGLILFARAVNGNGGYAGAEPLLSIVVCAISGAALLLSREGKV